MSNYFVTNAVFFQNSIKMMMEELIKQEGQSITPEKEKMIRECGQAYMGIAKDIGNEVERHFLDNKEPKKD